MQVNKEVVLNVLSRIFEAPPTRTFKPTYIGVSYAQGGHKSHPSWENLILTDRQMIQNTVNKKWISHNTCGSNAYSGTFLDEFQGVMELSRLISNTGNILYL